MAWKRSAWSILQEEVDMRLKLCVANIYLESLLTQTARNYSRPIRDQRYTVILTRKFLK